ncbi:MAG TPA: MFS transporter [Nitrososphaeraceae archaeon]|nr:MFS transporter [Nitrososphaeraceae archaeon]
MGSDTAASSSLIIARVIYGVNWFNVAAIFPLIALEFNKDVSLLGSITAAFLIGVGLFQIPAGIFAAKYGPRTSAIFGIATSSTAALLYGFASDASQLIWLRFIVGFGMAFFFSSAIILIAKYGKRDFPGFSIGMMNSAHSMGGIIGIFVWIIIAQILGWRTSIILSGVLGLVTALLMIIAIPKEERGATIEYTNRIQNKLYKPRKRQGQLKTSNILRILSNPPLVYLGLVLIGIQAAWALELTFIVVYLQNIGFSAEITGVIASLPLISAIVSAPLIGGFYDKIRDARKVLLICGVGMSMAIAGMSFDSLYIVSACTIFTGFFSGGAFTVVYEKARTLPILDIADYENEASAPIANEKGVNNDDMNHNPSTDSSSYYFDAIKVAWVNGLSLIGILWIPIVFSIIVMRAGYELAWILSAVVTALFVLIPLSKLSRQKNI